MSYPLSGPVWLTIEQCLAAENACDTIAAAGANVQLRNYLNLHWHYGPHHDPRITRGEY